MKRIITTIVMVVVLACAIFGLVACGGNDSGTTTDNTADNNRVEITASNYSDYFSISLTPNMTTKKSALGSTIISITISGSCDSKVTASFNNVRLTGYIQLPLSSSHPLYSEHKLPLDATFEISGLGHGDCLVAFSHGTGSYGGYSLKDFYFECTSASGYIVL